jgi:uncharacterized protein YbjQ (UPF0145 family)
LIVTTTENIPEARVVKTLGQVFGLTVRSRSLGGNLTAFVPWLTLALGQCSGMTPTLPEGFASGTAL